MSTVITIAIIITIVSMPLDDLRRLRKNQGYNSRSTYNTSPYALHCDKSLDLNQKPHHLISDQTLPVHKP